MDMVVFDACCIPQFINFDAFYKLMWPGNLAAPTSCSEARKSGVMLTVSHFSSSVWLLSRGITLS